MLTYRLLDSRCGKWYLVLFEGVLFRPLLAFLICCEDVLYVTILKGVWVVDFSQRVSRLLGQRRWVEEGGRLHLRLLILPDFEPLVRLC